MHSVNLKTPPFSLATNTTVLATILSLFLTLPAFAKDKNNNEETVTEIINTDNQLPLEDIRMFVEVFHQIRNNYVNEVSDEELLEYAINGMLQGLDPHSAYLNENAFSELQESTSGEFAGVGLEVSMENGFVKIITPIDDTPAAKADIEPGDLIIKLDNKAVKGLNLNQAIDLMRGPEGSKLELTLLRGKRDKPINVKLTRAIIKIKSVKSQLLEDNFGYLRIAQFQSNTGDDAHKQIKKLQKKAKGTIRGLILDLRNNPGGVLTSAIEVSDVFLEDGLIVYTEGRTPNSQESFHATENSLLKDKPIVVLMNSGSASASEIVAGALQDHKRALIVGTPSFGKGSVQSILPLPPNKGIKLTTARYYTPLGRSIQAAGIIPDIQIQTAKLMPIETEFGIKEADLSGHLSNDTKKQTDKNKNNALKTDDYQLYEALHLLKAISLSQR